MFSEKWTLDMFADDLTAYIGSLEDIRKWLLTLAEWHEISGLEVAKDKSGLWSVKWTSSEIRSIDSERVLGTFLTKEDSQRLLRGKDFIEGIQIKCKSWTLFCSLTGKSAIWNSVIGGRLRYIGHWMEL